MERWYLSAARHFQYCSLEWDADDYDIEILPHKKTPSFGSRGLAFFMILISPHVIVVWIDVVRIREHWWTFRAVCIS
jgi:hypothetical protein